MRATPRPRPAPGRWASCCCATMGPEDRRQPGPGRWPSSAGAGALAVVSWGRGAGRRQLGPGRWPALPHAELFRGEPGALHPVRDLLERDVPCVVRRAVIGLLVDAERREAAVVGRAEALRRDEV